MWRDDLTTSVRAVLLPNGRRAIRVLRVIETQLTTDQSPLLQAMIYALLYRPTAITDEESEVMIDAVVVDLSLVHAMMRDAVSFLLNYREACKPTETKLFLVGLRHPKVIKTIGEMQLGACVTIMRDVNAVIESLENGHR